MTVYKRKGSVFWCAKIQDVDGKWHAVSTGYEDEAQAAAWVREQVRDVEKIRKHKRNREAGALTLTSYAEGWIKRLKTATVKDDKTRLELHILPRIGHMPIADVRPRHCRDVIMFHRDAGVLSPKTIRELASLMTTLFKSALIDEVVTMQPSIYERGVLPKKADKDPTWRAEAIYTRGEVMQLLTDDRIPRDRRVFYALKFFTGRHSEVARLTWSQWERTCEPLTSLNVAYTKSKVPRRVPVHPVLAKILAEWKLEGWEDMYGEKPKPQHLIIPTRNLTRRGAAESQRQLLHDLEKIGLRVRAGQTRNRRGHDLRRTLITLSRADGAIDSLLRLVTHGASGNDMLDIYSTPVWADVCREISKLKIELPTGSLVQLGAVPVEQQQQAI